MPSVKKITASKVTLTHPHTGREYDIHESIYKPFKAAILQSLKTTQGKTFTKLTDDVVKTIRQKMPDFKKSIPWYTISILLDLETRGVVESFIEKGKKLNRLPVKKK
jgi:hypothetical protein